MLISITIDDVPTTFWVQSGMMTNITTGLKLTMEMFMQQIESLPSVPVHVRLTPEQILGLLCSVEMKQPSQHMSLSQEAFLSMCTNEEMTIRSLNKMTIAPTEKEKGPQNEQCGTYACQKKLVEKERIPAYTPCGTQFCQNKPVEQERVPCSTTCGMQYCKPPKRPVYTTTKPRAAYPPYDPVKPKQAQPKPVKLIPVKPVQCKSN